MISMVMRIRENLANSSRCRTSTSRGFKLASPSIQRALQPFLGHCFLYRTWVLATTYRANFQNYLRTDSEQQLPMVYINFIVHRLLRPLLHNRELKLLNQNQSSSNQLSPDFFYFTFCAASTSSESYVLSGSLTSSSWPLCPLNHAACPLCSRYTVTKTVNRISPASNFPSDHSRSLVSSLRIKTRQDSREKLRTKRI